jgi:LemA protein
MGTPTIIIIVLVALVLLFVMLYNSLVKTRNQAKEAWSGIDVQLKRRYDLIPNLLNTVKGYAEYEKDVFESVTKARVSAMSATGVADKSQAESGLTGALKSLFAVAENYPELKADKSFLNLQQELSDTEDKIMAARRFYNSTVKKLNTALESVPTNVVGKMFGFEKREFFELEGAEKEAAKNPVEVKF